MKKLALTFAIVLGLGMASYAEGGGLFGQGQTAEESTATTSMYNRSVPGLPGHGHGQGGNQPAPVGSGIAVLMSLGAAYLVGKRRKED